jgi:Zn-dependent M16 (insulinase) family peptidase
MDKPSSPAGEAKRAFFNNLFGRDRDFLSRFRQRVLAVTVDDLRRVAATWLQSDNASTGVVTGKAQLAESQLRDLQEFNL